MDDNDTASLSSDGFIDPDGIEPSRCSSSTSSVRIGGEHTHCQLTWSDHRHYLTDYFDALFQSESMVDVTLVSDGLSIRAHRVVLSACSGFLGGLLADNPCSHPVVILKEVSDRQLQALVHFMYRGELVNVARQDLAALVQIADALQIRGLTWLETVGKMAATETRSVGRTSDGVYVKRDLYPNSSPDDDIRHRHRDDDDDVDRPPVLKLARYAISPAPLLSLHHHHYGFESQHTSPIPRRKQARPRRRSGDSSTTATSPSLMIDQQYKSFMSSSPSPVQDMPEDLSVKKSPPLMSRQQENEDQSGRSNDQDSRSDTPLPVPSLKADSINSDSAKSEFSLAERNSLFSPGPSAGPPVTMTTPPTPNSLLSMTPIHQSDRRKGQHSAPRGGPPRAWTNGDLTEALNHVWNRKMTTSQASRVFGIPYNSLLMYVRGKYGKSLKLDTLRKETLEGEAMALAASTRGSYKLAAAAAAAAAATTPNSSKTSKSNASSNESNSAPTTPTMPTASAKSVNNNNNNNNMNNHNHNNNNTEVKVSKNPSITPGHLNLAGGFPTPHLNEMEALSMAGLAAAGLGGFGGVNPYLSYFCDFSFPMPMGLGGLMQPAAAAASKHIRAADVLHKKTSELRSSVGKISKHRAKGLAKSTADQISDIEADNKEDTDVDDGPSPLPLRLSRPQTGHV